MHLSSGPSQDLQSQVQLGRGELQEGKEAAASVATCRSKALVILGMHRSGTSALTRVCNLLGARLGGNLMPPTPGNNEAGFWEQQEIADLHDRLLAEFGSRWDDYRAMPEGWQATPKADPYKLELLTILRRDLSDAGVWALKDPRMCRLVPFWLSIVADMGGEPYFLLAIRNPLEVAASLTKRDNLHPSKSVLLWLRHMLDAERGTRGYRRAFVNYDALVADWRQAMVAAFGALGLDCADQIRERGAEIDEFLSVRYRHHAFSVEDLAVDPIVAGWAREAYLILQEMGETQNASLLRRLDQLSAALQDAEQLFAPLLAAEQAELAARQARIEELSRELGAAREESTSGLARFEEKHRVWQAQVADLTRNAELLRSQLVEVEQKAVRDAQRIQHEKAAVELEVAQARSDLEDLRASWSWRLTQPFRLLRAGGPGKIAESWRAARLAARELREILDSNAYDSILLKSLAPVKVEVCTEKVEEMFRWIPQMEIGGDRREALFLHPPAQVTYELTVPPRAVFRAYIALQREVWEKNPGGVQFRVTVAAGGRKRLLKWKARCHPRKMGRHRGWNVCRLSLRRFAGQQVQLTLATSAPPRGTTHYAWAVWGEPVILERKRPLFSAAALGKILSIRGICNLYGRARRLVFERAALEKQVRRTATRRENRAGLRERGSGGLPECKRFALYSSSRGNYFFHEIRDLMAAGFEELGFEVQLRDENEGFNDENDWHMVIAPHEFFQLGVGQELCRKPLPRSLIVVNTEQPSTKWFALARECFAQAHAIWDIDYQSSELLRSQGLACDYLPLGYVAGFRAFQEIEELPLNYGTVFLEKEIRQHSCLDDAIAHRPMDVTFVGQLTPRREEFFARAASHLAGYRCYLKFGDGANPVIPGATTYMNTATMIGLAQRTKILLNIHRGEEMYFEWHRVVMQGIWQGALVITEPCSDAPPFRAGRDFVEASLAELPETIRYYLSSPEGRQEAETIVARGRKTLMENCQMADLLRARICQLFIPRSQAAFWPNDVWEQPGRHYG